MEDQSFCEDYDVEDDTDDEFQGISSDEDNHEKDFAKFLTLKDGKDVLHGEEGELGLQDHGDDIVLGDQVAAENLLYDENIDKDNEEWMKKKRNQYKMNKDTYPKSDAVLSCPACMVTVCVDCQRHDLYKNQFRAMFVMNCVIVTDQFLRYEHKNKSKKRRKKEGPGKLVEYKPDDIISSEQPADVIGSNQTFLSVNSGSEMTSAVTHSSTGGEIFNPVKCEVCETEIAVYDRDEVYHFFNVLESLA